MRDLVNLYFKDHNIVNHHVASFNDFLATENNPNSRTATAQISNGRHICQPGSVTSSMEA